MDSCSALENPWACFVITALIQHEVSLATQFWPTHFLHVLHQEATDILNHILRFLVEELKAKPDPLANFEDHKYRLPTDATIAARRSFRRTTSSRRCQKSDGGHR